MDKNLNKCFLLVLLSFAIVSCSSKNLSEDDQPSEVFSEVMSLNVNGTSAEECFVYGEQNRLLGSGSPSDITYEVGDESAVKVICDDDTAIVETGSDSVTMSSSSRFAALILDDVEYISGTFLITRLLENISTNEDQLQLNITTQNDLNLNLNASESSTPDFAGDITASALATFLKHLDKLDRKQNDKARIRSLMKVFLSSGYPILINDMSATNSTINKCTTAKAQKFLAYTSVATEEEFGQAECLVYHRLDAVTNTNFPDSNPANNQLNTMRYMLTENGILTTLLNTLQKSAADKVFTIDDILNHLFVTLGYTAYTEDSSGVITDVTVTSDDIKAYLDDILKKDLENWNISDDRFHTTYNPTGGPTFDVLSTGFQDDFSDYTDDCFDWTGNNLSNCPLTPLYFDFDGETLTQNESGDYVLKLEYRDGGFVDEAYVVHKTTSLPFRDSFFEPMSVSLADNGFDKDDLDTRYYVNALHKNNLNPLANLSGDSVPFSSSYWQGLFSNLEAQDNAYLHPSPEISARGVIVIHRILNSDRIRPVEALFLINHLTRALAAIPLEDGSYALLRDHAKTITEWESLTDTFLQGGVEVRPISGRMNLRITNGELSFTPRKNCKGYAKETESCDMESVSLLVDKDSKTTDENGDVIYTLSGSLELTGDNFGTQIYTPTTLRINSSGNRAYLEGATDFAMHFKAKKLITKIDGDKNFKSNARFEALREILE